MRKRSKNPIELLDPVPTDPRLQAVGRELQAWEADGVLTMALRRSGPAPMLFGTVREPLRAVGDDCWALRLRVPDLEKACIEYALVDDGRVSDQRGVWRGPKAGPEAPVAPVSVGSAVVLDSRHTKVAERHRASLWVPDAPQALMLCADGEGLQSWASVIAAAGLPVALVGIVSAGLRFQGSDAPYDAKQDPRACAYLPHVDPKYFADHMSYVIDSVLPWACASLGDLPTLVFGTSNGAAFAASAAANHPDTFAGALVFSLGVPPRRPARNRNVLHALVAGRLEPGFQHTTIRYARRLRLHRVPVHLVRPVRGHDHTMWCDELIPALHWILASQAR